MIKEIFKLIGMLPDYMIAWCDDKIESLNGKGIKFEDREDV